VAISPFLAFCFYLLFRKKSKWNFWKYEIAIIYMLGHSLFIWIIFKLLFLPFPQLQDYAYYSAFLSLFYITFAMIQLHYSDFKIKLFIIFRIVLAFLLASIGMVALLGLFKLLIP
ncbi:MAG: hypothetical protein WBA74_00965, partial [Cyclobacteriaceae bacterium]